jgi:histone deacetylase 1/2
MENSLSVRKTGRKRRRDEKNYKDAGSGTGSGNVTPVTGPGGSDAASDTVGGSGNKDTGATKKDDVGKGSEDDDQNLNEYDEELEALRKETEADDDGDVEMEGNEKPLQTSDISAVVDASNDEEMADVAGQSLGMPAKGGSMPPVEEPTAKKPRLDTPAAGDGTKTDIKDPSKTTSGSGAETESEAPKPTALNADIALERSPSTPDGPAPSLTKALDGPPVASSSAEEKSR